MAKKSKVQERFEYLIKELREIRQPGRGLKFTFMDDNVVDSGQLTIAFGSTDNEYLLELDVETRGRKIITKFGGGSYFTPDQCELAMKLYKLAGKFQRLCALRAT